MSVAIAPAVGPRGRLRDLLSEVARGVLRWGLLALGVILTVVGILISPLPGPGGLPVTVIGLMLVLRNSYAAKKVFVRFQHRHTRLVFPLRRLLRREPEVLPVIWQQVLRFERAILPREWRRAIHLRRKYFRR